MPAYSFQPRFVEPIRAGTKGGTIRAARKIGWTTNNQRSEVGGHAWPGETLYLYCRQRQKSGFKIGEHTCIAVQPIWLNFATRECRIGGLIPGCSPDALAQFDGFSCWEELAGFWRETHGLNEFSGWHIRWRPLPGTAPA